MPDAGVGDRDLARSHRRAGATPRRAIVPPARRELQRVGDEVVEDLLQHVGIEVDLRSRQPRPAAAGWLKVSVVPRRSASSAKGITHHAQRVREIAAAGVQAHLPGFGFREIEQL